ncbi:MAG TPA: hypothetical protein DC014_03840 [Treponema sp.]|nr:hypothetical protein [Treponema sp.]
MTRLRSALALLLFLCIPLSFLNGQSIDGIAQTQELAERLHSSGFDFTLQSLVTADQTTFPQNIIVTIPPLSAPPSEIKSTVFVFTQDFASLHPDFIDAFLENLQKLKLSDEILVLFCADEADIEAAASTTRIEGSEVYTYNIEDEDKVCAVIYEESPLMQVIPGSDGKTAPLWLSQAVMEASKNAHCSPTFPGNLMLLYRLSLLDGGKRLSLFLNAELASIGISAPADSKTADFLAQTALTINTMRSDQWDNHYTAVRAGDVMLWTNEFLFVVGHIVIVTFMLITLAFSNFSDSSKNVALKKDFARTWFTFPALLALLSLLLFMFSGIWSCLKDNLYIIEAKVLSTLLCAMVVLCMQIRMRWRISFSVLGYATYILAAFCLIFCSFVDISLVFPFGILYIITLVTRKVRKPSFLILTFPLMLLPFAPYFLHIVQHAPTENLRSAAYTSFTGTVLTALMLSIPLTLWMRIIIALRVLASDTINANTKSLLPSRKTLIRSALTVGISILIASLLVIVPTLLLRPKSFAQKKTSQAVIYTGENKGRIQLSYEESSFMAISARHIIVHTETPVFRYEISVSSSQGIPLYESNYEYVLDEQNRAQFRLPDWPGSDIEIVYSTDDDADSTITLDAYLLNDDKSLERISITYNTAQE